MKETKPEREQGKSTVIFFNGFILGKNAYAPLISELRLGYQVTQPSKDGLLDLKKGTDQENIDVPDNCVLISHSAGCISAVEVAKRNPGKVKKLILLNPVGFTNDRHIKDWAKRFAVHALKLNLHPTKTSLAIDADFIKQLLTRRTDLVKQGVDLTNFNLLKALSGMTMPILIIYSDKDDIVDIPNNDSLRELPENVKIEKVEGDHYWSIKNPREVSLKIGNL
jgi:pimeloyl-ACP methyl ester carboxylesterase